MRFFRLLWLWILISGVGVSSLDCANASPNLGEKGLFGQVTFQSGQDSREFRMRVPENYDPARPIGILFGFHGFMGNHPSRNPNLHFLQGMGFEDKAADGYLITVSLSVRRSADGWKGGWCQEQGLEKNFDARAVRDAVALLKQHYAINDHRIYATGFSHGGEFCTTLPQCLPGFLAAIAPICPAAGCHLPKDDAHHACIGVGGLADKTWGSTADKVRSISNWHRDHNTDAACYVFDMGHSSPSDDVAVTPPRPWVDTVIDYFTLHPLAGDTAQLPPAMLAAPFKDDFNPTSAKTPDGSRWTVDRFDANGVLYGVMGSPDEARADLAGYGFLTRDGFLASSPAGKGRQGGLCLTRFAQGPVDWSVSFIMDHDAPDLAVIPALMVDPRGQVLALKCQPSGWRWEATSNQLAFRANQAKHVTQLSSGTLALARGTEYTCWLSKRPGRIDWCIMEGRKPLAKGSLPGKMVKPDPVRFGLGLIGTDAAVRFDAAQLQTARAN
jgi:poly(3-hydroxybutyrate) depolymerase